MKGWKGMTVIGLSVGLAVATALADDGREFRQQDGACCYFDGVNLMCTITSEDECNQMPGGIWRGPGSTCDDFDGSGVADVCEEPTKLGACCAGNYAGQCLLTTEFGCQVVLGYWMGVGTTCADLDGNGVADICDDAKNGACCWEDADLGTLCQVMTIEACDERGGMWYGPGTDCSDLNGNGTADICEELEVGACCYIDLDLGIFCQVITLEACDQLGGTWYGPATDCSDLNGDGVADICEEPKKGACCWEDADGVIACVVTTEDDCILQYLGTWHGPGTDCSDLNGNGVADICEELEIGACCWEDADLGTLCQVVTIEACADLSGVWHGVGTDCSDLDGNGVADICEEPEIGACCYTIDGVQSCINVTEVDCELLYAGAWKGAGTVCLGDLNGDGVDDACEDPAASYWLEFSLDIGSDKELSDPFVDGDEAFDPGDVYLWMSAPVLSPGRDGFKDDALIFGRDPWPSAPDPADPPASRVPVGMGNSEFYGKYFDLDGHDQLADSLREAFNLNGERLPYPIPQFDSPCIYLPDHLLVSFDDDMAPGWPAGDVAVTAPSPAGNLYGSAGARDEVVGLKLQPAPLPQPVLAQYPFADERRVHLSLRPDPPAEEQDDDVDSLDVVPGIAGDDQPCKHWYFTADHEAKFAGVPGTVLDPGDIYEVLPGGGYTLVIDGQANLGLPFGTDVDAFEFVWVDYPEFGLVFAVIFSVDDDDPLTMGIDESGGLNPAQLYVSVLTGEYTLLTPEPLPDDIDGVTAWYKSLAACPGDANCDAAVDFFDIDPFVVALTASNNPVVWQTWLVRHGYKPDCDFFGNNDINGDGSVDFFDIDPFVVLLATGARCP